MPIALTGPAYDNWISVIKSSDKYEYSRNEDIYVRLKIFVSRDNGFVKIREEIPRDFSLVGLVPQSDSNLKIRSYYDPNKIMWEIAKLSPGPDPTILEYIIRTDKGTMHTLGTTSVTAYSGGTFLFPSPTITVSNRPPQITITSSPNRTIWHNEPNYIKATVVDPDNDSILCELYRDSVEVIPFSGSQRKIYSKNNHTQTEYSFFWDVSTFGAGPHSIYLKANDGYDVIKTEVVIVDIKNKFLNIIPISSEYVYTLLGGFLGGVVTIIGFLVAIFRDEIKKFILKLKYQIAKTL